MIVSLSINKDALHINLGYRQNYIGQKRKYRKNLTEVYHQLKLILAEEFGAAFELLVTDELPLDPRHKTKVLREKIHLYRIRWSLQNILLGKRLSKHSRVDNSNRHSEKASNMQEETL